MAVVVCKRILDTADSLHGLMSHDAWYIAWRKARPENFSDELLEADKETWKAYTTALTEWQKSDICNTTELKSFFGGDGAEAKLNDKASDYLRAP
jgi:hypothetical protein